MNKEEKIYDELSKRLLKQDEHIEFIRVVDFFSIIFAWLLGAITTYSISTLIN